MWEQLKNEFGEELVAVAWKSRRLLGGLTSTSWDLPWVFLSKCGSGLARVWIGSWGILQNFLLALYLAVTGKALQPDTLHVISYIYLWINNCNLVLDLALLFLVFVFSLHGCIALHQMVSELICSWVCRQITEAKAVCTRTWVGEVDVNWSWSDGGFSF